MDREFYIEDISTNAILLCKSFQSCSTLCDPTIAHHAPLFMEFPRQEYWSSLPSLTPGDLPDPGIEPASLASPILAGGFPTTASPGKPCKCYYKTQMTLQHLLRASQALLQGLYMRKPEAKATDIFCYELNVCILLNSYAEILMLNMMVLGGGAFGRVLGHEGGALMNRMSALLRDITEFASSLCSLQEDSPLQMRKQVLTRTHPYWHPGSRLQNHKK